ncbi:MAG: hypothetical protein ABJA02_01260 [Acidobacteriota bacterium]
MHFAKKLFYAVVILIAATTLLSAQKLKAEDVIAKHLESIGTAEARAATKNMIAVGTGTSKYLSTADLSADGRIVIASEGPKFFLGINLTATSTRFADELFTFDGENGGAASPRQGQRSNLGTFVQANKMMIDQGLFGGELSTGWVMENISENKGKIAYAGIKKIDGTEMYALDYSKKGGGDIEVTLYFDKSNFRHLRTEYKRMSSAGIGSKPEYSSQYIETRFKIIEEFGDHRPEGGLTLPHSYRIVYSSSGQSGTVEAEWKFAMSEFAKNQKFDPSTFKAPSN